MEKMASGFIRSEKQVISLFGNTLNKHHWKLAAAFSAPSQLLLSPSDVF